MINIIDRSSLNFVYCYTQQEIGNKTDNKILPRTITIYCKIL